VGAKPATLGPALLRAGLAKLQPFFAADRVAGGSELMALQATARDARLKVCMLWGGAGVPVERPRGAPLRRG